jgi:hypothetical protein
MKMKRVGLIKRNEGEKGRPHPKNECENGKLYLEKQRKN